MKLRKKLIEVALPLEAINDASAYDKMPGIGPHPKGIHHWWARLPLPVARAVLFASVVDDPSANPEVFPTAQSQDAERERLFGVIRSLMQKKMHDRPEAYAAAHAELRKHCEGVLPVVLDPFAGGGSIPLEATRLGFVSCASDLNPVAVLLNRCTLEMVPHWSDCAPINPEVCAGPLRRLGWQGAGGLAVDVRYYSEIILKRAVQRIGHLYPKVRLTAEYGGRDAVAIAWIWTRTVASPNPAVRGAHVPLVRSFWLTGKNHGRGAYVRPTNLDDPQQIGFSVVHGQPEGGFDPAKGTVNRSGAVCLLTGAPIPFSYIRTEGKRGNLSTRLMAIVAESPRGRVYVSPTFEQEEHAHIPIPSNVPDTDIPSKALGFRVQLYGMDKHAKLFSPRQLTAIATLSQLIRETHRDVLADAMRAGLGCEDAEEYARTLATLLALALDRCCDFNNTLCRWSPSNEKVMNLFGKQAIPMVWDFAEANVLGQAVGSWSTCADYVARCVEVVGKSTGSAGTARQIDAASSWDGLTKVLVSTDPPYYDNIGYAALSDFFYVWLRRTIGELHPDLFQTVLVPKEPELTAAPERFAGSKTRAKEHFESGFRKSFTSLREKMDQRFPLTVYYAFRQEGESQENDAEVSASSTSVDRTTGWETLLQALLESGFQITATWPIRASQKWRMVAMGTNALASYIVLACRPRPIGATQGSRHEFVTMLRAALPNALKDLQRGNIAPVDLAQAAIGPGMAVYSRYSRVLDAAGSPVTVRDALSVINQVLDEVLTEQEGECDSDTRWALAWFEQHGFDTGEYGIAEVLSKAKDTSVGGMVDAGILQAKGGKVRLLRPAELPVDWDPSTDKRLTAWEMVHHLVRAQEFGGDEAAAAVMAKLGSKAEVARDLAYRLYAIAERKNRAAEALWYNSLVQSWPDIVGLAEGLRKPTVGTYPMPEGEQAEENGA